jgi:predicted acyltransferase
MADDRATPSERLTSIDALRGFDMFWIIGADEVVAALRKLPAYETSSFLQGFVHQLEHVEWQGFVFYDLIFPLFVFLMGVSIPLAFTRRLARGESKGQLYWQLFRRSAILYLLGVFYYGGLSNSFDQIRFVGVLQRIAFCYFFGGLIYLNTRPRGQAIWLAGLLLGYWAMLALIPVPGHGAGVFTPEGNFTGYVDRLLLPGKAWFDSKGWGWDPEGLLSTLPAIGTCLIGVLAGQLLVSATPSPARKALYLLAAGAVVAPLGYLWGHWFPIIKNIWTSSFVLTAGGYSLLLLGLFYLVIDVWKLRAWAFPLIVIGMNAITIYMATDLVKFDVIAERLVGGPIAASLGAYAELLLRSVKLAVEWLFLYWLYRRGIFLRV